MIPIQLVFAFVVATTSMVTDTDQAASVKLNWKKHYATAKRQAQAAERPLVVVLENPSKAAEKIDDTRLRDKNRKTIAEKKFELVRVDVNTDYGKRVAAAFGAKQFPYTAVTDDRSVRIVYRKTGQMTEQDWTVALAKSADVDWKKRIKTEPKGIAKNSSYIEWMSDFDSGQARMRKEGRPLLLYITAQGCTYCERLRSEAFSLSHVISDINQSFIPVKVDGRLRQDIAQRFQVRLFPTLAIIHPNGEVVEMWSGYTSVDDFQTHLRIGKSRIRDRQIVLQ